MLMPIAPTAAINRLKRKVNAIRVVGPSVRQLYRKLKHATVAAAVPVRAAGALAAFRVSGGIGDYLIAARFIRDLMAAAGDFYFDLYGSHKPAISIAFAEHPFLNRIYEEDTFVNEEVWKSYPLTIRIFHFPVVYTDDMDREAVGQANPKLLRICADIETFIQDNDFAVFVRDNSNLDGALGAKAYFKGFNRSNLAHGVSNISYGGDRFAVPRDAGALPKFLLTGRKYVTIHNGFDEYFSGASSARYVTKVYPRFDEVVEALKKGLGDVLIVQIGGKTSTPIAGVDVNLVNRTTLAEAAEILGNAALHIDNEGGLVHLASCLGVFSCVIFGSTSVDYFAYPENINVRPHFCGGCWWATRDWLFECPRGFGEARCLTETPPEEVADVISIFLNERKNNVNAAKKPLAFLLGITKNLAFAAGNVALSINKYMPNEVYDILVYYTELEESDMNALQRIPNIRLVRFELPEPFVRTMLTRIPAESRFRDVNHLMAFCHFEAFSLLDHYINVAWLDADVAVQANLKDIVDFCPFGMSLDTPWTVQNNFTQPIDGYQMGISGFCTAVMVVNDTLPYRKLHKWCYEKAIEYADRLITADQGIINLALQEFAMAPKPMPLEKWQCISWKDEANVASIVHFGTSSKVWNETNICNAFPEWYRMHLQWLALGGNDFDQGKIHPRNPLPALNEFDRIRDHAHSASAERSNNDLAGEPFTQIGPHSS